MNVQQSQQFFNTVMYARAYINEIKVITPKKGSAYGAVNASVLDKDAEGKTLYQTVDLVISGQEVKRLLWAQRDRWPTDRMQRAPERWVADINIGSLRTESYVKKDGTVGAVLKGRLIKIRNLRIGNEDILGEISDDFRPSLLVSPGYINLIDPEKARVKATLLDGKVEEPEYRSINLDLQEEIPAINELIARDLCPHGYAHRDTNPQIFAILEISGVFCQGFKGKDGSAQAALNGVLSKVRYLKANNEIIIAGKEKDLVNEVEPLQAEVKPKGKALVSTKAATKAKTKDYIEAVA